MELDLAAAVAEVEEAGLAVAAAGDDPPRDPVPRLGLDPRRQPLVRGPHLGDLLAPGELVRERLDPRLADPLQLLAPVARGRRRARVRRARSSRREPIGRQAFSILVILSFFFGPRGTSTVTMSLRLLADQGFADRRLVGELVLERVGLGRADDLEFLRVAGFLVFDVDDRAEADLVGAERLLVDHGGAAQPLLELGDPALEQRLFVLGVVVFGVLGDVAEFARLLDPRRDLAAFASSRGTRFPLSASRAPRG